MTVVVEPTTPIARIVLDDADRRNPLGLDTLRLLDRSFAELGERPDVDVIVLAARGPAFSAGHDLREMRDRDEAYFAALFDACVDLMATIHRVPQPVIAAVDGVATAAGCQLVAACDLAIASTRSSFATPGVRIGLFCSTPMVPLSRAIGRKRSLELLLTGRPIDAATAATWGLVNRVVEPDELDAAVAELAADIAAYSSETIAIGKEAFHHQIDLSEPDAYAYTREVMTANAATADAQEGIGAFLDKRDPAWGGR